MSFDDTLRRYRAGQFTDEDVTECTGLSVRAWRELIKLKAVQTTQQRGPGRVRQCDPTTFKRTAVIAALHAAGFSLTMAGRLGYLLPFDDRIYGFCDPIAILFNATAEVDPVTELPPRREPPPVDWFDEDKPAKVDRDHDCSIEIFEGRFVGFSYFGRIPWIYGELRDNRAQFTSWYPFGTQGYIYDEQLKKVVETSVPKWDYRAQSANKIDLDFLDYNYENHGAKDDALRIAAGAAMRNPVLRTTVNLSLAIRKSIRRYLGIELEF